MIKNDVLTVRLTSDLREELRLEAKSQKIAEAVLVRMFIRDGLVRYNASTDVIVQNTERISSQLDTLQQIIAATLHLVAEQPILARTQRDGEEHQAYVDRLSNSYQKSIYGALSKGKSIIGAVENEQFE